MAPRITVASLPYRATVCHPGYVLTASVPTADAAAEGGSATGDLDERLERDMIETVYRTAGRETGYWASYFLRAVRRHGGVAAARRMLGTKGLSKGLVTLHEKGRLDLAMETLVLRPEYGSLFTDEERAVAARRLAQVESGAAAGRGAVPA